jgi:internalin A
MRGRRSATMRLKRCCFSIRSLLVFVAASAILVALWSVCCLPYRRQSAAAKWLANEGAFVRVDDLTPNWIRPLVGDNYLSAATAVEYREFDREITQDHFSRIAELTSLHNLGLECTRFRSSDLESLRRLKELRVLGVGFTSSMTDSALENVGGIQSLERLYLSETSVSDAGMIWISGLTRLTYLDLSGTAVSSRELRCLEPLHELEFLNLESTRISDLSAISKLTHLEELNLNNTAVSTTNVAAIRVLPKLKRLRLCNTSIDDGVVTSLAAIKCLEMVDIRGTRVSKKAEEELAARLSGITIGRYDSDGP